MTQSLGRQQAESQAVASEKHVYWNPLEEARRSRVWDTVDQAWSKPLLEGDVFGLYLRKVVYKCSVCDFTSSRTSDVLSHTNRVMGQGELHIDAELEPFEGANRTRGLHCTGCDTDFLSRAGQGRKHLNKVQVDFESHAGQVEELAIMRFTLSPSEPPILKRVVVREGLLVLPRNEPDEDKGGPDSAQVVRSIAPPNRKRRRRHKSRRGHGNANADA
jgi:hypothetical protein